jgi:hypothetical protein
MPGRSSGTDSRSRAAEAENDRRDAELILKVLVEGRFPAIWLPSKELQDLRALLRQRHPTTGYACGAGGGLRRGLRRWLRLR